MTNRSAVDTIKGYFYQFDLTIKKILELKEDGESIIIEGIEDIDVKSTDEDTAIQCKYYAKSEYNHSVIAKPIRLMLTHFKESISSSLPAINYYLYGYFKRGQDKLTLPLDVQQLKERFLIYRKDNERYELHNILDLTDQELETFLKQLTININADDYDTQLTDIHNSFTAKFKCSLFQAEHYYYNNALQVIKRLATSNSIEDRTITKKEFLDEIDKSQLLFNEWFHIYKERKEINKSYRDEYFSTLNVSPFERFFLIEVDPSSYTRSYLKELLFIISNKWSKLSQRERNSYCPYVYIHKLDYSELIQLKGELITEQFRVIDGFDFSGASFNVNSVLQTATYHNNIKLKILNSLDDLILSLESSTKTREIYQFYLEEEYFDYNSAAVKHIKIPVEEIKDIKEII
ncbi:DUF4297 family anti-phage-associated protein [Terribacillus sp. 7520-G]|uniref:DUF4297 family anti-phage-associated protein n=1 Tax=Terribacillus TaxID=459532 RepID=UPI000BA51D08|nr:DUF4297 family anti-phage-associated protein [Terribacillus sp. 7520-G]PAD38206.1 hypothetical protein CHH53_11985 [Terribacillus sp. 7520-G]